VWRNSFWTWWEQKSGYAIGPALILVAWIIGHFVRPYYSTHFLDDVVVALLTAGVLAVAVDPFVKRKAQREATRDIFHHMLGFSLPAVIRERLQSTVEQTKLYRRNLIEHVVVGEDGDYLVFETEVEFEVLNPTPHDLDFLPSLEFEKSEQPVLKSLTCFGEPNCGKRAKIERSFAGLGFECKGASIVIPSERSKKFKYEYSVRYPCHASNDRQCRPRRSRRQPHPRMRPRSRGTNHRLRRSPPTIPARIQINLHRHAPPVHRPICYPHLTTASRPFSTAHPQNIFHSCDIQPLLRKLKRRQWRCAPAHFQRTGNLVSPKAESPKPEASSQTALHARHPH